MFCKKTPEARFKGKSDWGSTFSRLSFWYGLPFADIAYMPLAAMEAYTANLSGHQAELRLILFDVIGTLYMEEGDRRSQIRKWEQAAGIKRERIVPPAILRMAGISVSFVPREDSRNTGG